KRHKPVPTIEQIKHVIETMPSDTDIEKRNKALIAFTILTGARDKAISTLKLKHVDISERCINQDAREVETKFSKSFVTYFFPVGDDIRQIIEDWVIHLRENLLWGNDDPLFPATKITIGKNNLFETDGLLPKHWSNADSIRKIFKEAFTYAELSYFNPHSFRNTLAILGQMICRTPEEYKAWSQNLGHENVMTTFISYGDVPNQRQSEIIQNLTMNNNEFNGY
ncbi:MAG: site-specific integrase, partial [Planctomycetota bacterium]